MVPFAYSQAKSVAAASGARHGSEAADAGMDFIAGGTDMIQLMQERVRNPGQVVDIAALPGLAGIASTANETTPCNQPARQSQHSFLDNP